MSTRIDYSAEEWTAISTAPQAARLFMGLAIAAAESAVVNQPVAVGQGTASAADVPELIKVVINSIRCGAGQPLLQDGLSNDRVKYALLNTVTTAVRAVEHRSPVEVEAFKAWLACVAAKVSRTSKDQSRLIDGRHSGGEPDDVRQLADVLAVGARHTRHLGPQNSRAPSTRSSLPRRSVASSTFDASTVAFVGRFR